jgi:hypothetical protein
MLRRKIISLLAAVLLGSAMAVAVGTPAQAWSYCHPPERQSYNNKLNLYRSEGYCGGWTYLGVDFGHCLSFANPAGDWRNNWTGSVWNRITGARAVLFDTPDCNYVNGPYMSIWPNTADPDLHDNYNWRNVSSINFFPS